MSKQGKLGSNQPCLCGSGLKYKKCCRGRLDWNALAKAGPDACIRNLCARGKNLWFLHRIAEALQFDKIDQEWSLQDLKRAVTPRAVRSIHEAVVSLWPDINDLGRVLDLERARTSGLYVGAYHPSQLIAGVTRHSLYSESMLLLDPFLHAMVVRREVNPLEHPEMHRMSTLRSLRIWLSMAPWIDAGIVRFVHSPSNLHPGVLLASMALAKERLERHPALKELLDREVARSEEMPDMAEMTEFYFLSIPDKTAVDALRSERPETTDEEIEQLLAYRARRREEHPFFLDPPAGGRTRHSELLMFSTGTSYDDAKVIAAKSGSHLITDLPTRWKEIEIDRAEGGVKVGPWEPFAKAFSEVDLKYIENVTLKHALNLRHDGKLAKMRSFMGRVWRECVSEEPFAEARAEDLAIELHEHVREADAEWGQINRRLVTALSAAGVAAVGVIVTGATGFVPATLAGAASGFASLSVDQMRSEPPRVLRRLRYVSPTSVVGASWL